MSVSAICRTINKIMGLKSIDWTGGTNLRIGARSGLTILSKKTLSGWYRSIKKDIITSTIIMAINILKAKLIIVASKGTIIYPVIAI
jgi:hypothetical protein